MADEIVLTSYQRNYIAKMQKNVRQVRNLRVVSKHEESGAVKVVATIRRRVGAYRWAWLSGEVTWVFPTPEAKREWFTKKYAEKLAARSTT